MRIQRVITNLMVVMAVAAWATGASADRLRQLVREGNGLFAQEKYEEALEKYRSAQVESPESPDLYFNIANALQRQGKHEEAIETYEKVYSRERPSLGAWAAYNIGVAQYRQAEQKIGTQEYQEALKQLEACMESNRDAMKMDPEDPDPKYNYEQAKRKWKEVLDALKKQMEEQKKQQQQDKNQQNKDDQQQDQQPDQQQQDDEKKDQQQKDDEKKDQQQDQEKKKDGQQQQDDQNQDQASSPTAQPQQAQPQQIGEMTPEEAERILNSLPEQNAEDLRRFQMKGMPRGRSFLKDW